LSLKPLPTRKNTLKKMKTRPRIIIVKTGRAVPEARGDGRDFEHWFADGLGASAFDFRVVRVDAAEALPPIESLAQSTGVLVTGSPAMVSHRDRWSERTAGWLAEAHASGIAILGVCFGHQLLAHALGGRVGPNSNGRRMGRVTATVRDPSDALLGGLGGSLSVHVSHLEAVLEPPSSARVIASADHDPFHALYFGRRSWGVQFHPEFDARITRDYLEARAALLADEGSDAAALIADLDADHDGPSVLARFAERVRKSTGCRAA
jgi:GMP synthase (glutamine-hydrolysing)